jgi:type II secretory pathway pseudopilin PulG
VTSRARDLASRLARREEGFTLLELVFTSALLLVVAAIFQQLLISTQTAVQRELDRSETTDAVGLAMFQIERQVRSGNLFYDPSLDSDPANGIVPGMSLRVYTQANASTSAYPNRCVQWRIYLDRLDMREWSPAWQENGYVTDWRTVTSGVVNRSQTPTVPAFTLDQSQSLYGNRLVNIVLLTNTRSSSGPAARVESSVTGRNTGYGFPASVCNNIPPYS